MSILIGFVCVLLAGFLLAVPTARKQPNWFLAAFLFLTAIELSVWLWSDTALASSWVADVWVALGRLQMPAFFFFFLSRCYSDFRLKRHDVLHLMPFALTLGGTFFSGSLPQSGIIAEAFIPGTAASAAISHIIYYGYMAAILGILWKFRQRFRRHYSGGRSEVLIWLAQLAAASLFAHTLVLIRDTINFTSGGAVVLALQLVGAVLALAITTWIALKSLLQPDLFRDVDRRLLRFDTAQDAASETELQRVLQVVDAQKPYLDPDLSLSDLAHQLALTPRELSELLNGSLRQHFFDFVNERRVEHAKALLVQTPRLSVMQVLQESGFNSKSSFNTAFKKHVDLTPSAFRAREASPAG